MTFPDQAPIKETDRQHFVMQRLQLSPLPCLRPTEAPASPMRDRDGFVDETVVLALLNGPLPQREVPRKSECVLPADDLDYAGWNLPTTPAKRTMRPVTPETTASQRPAPPVPTEPGLDEPHQGQHRWWLAALAGAMSTLLVSLLLLTLSTRLAPRTSDNPVVMPHAEPKPSMPIVPAHPGKAAPQLTDAAL